MFSRSEDVAGCGLCLIKCVIYFQNEGDRKQRE